MPFMPKPNMPLEPEFHSAYSEWKNNPSPESNLKMLDALHPTIESAIKTHVGASNPLLLSRARQLALSSLDSYDPSRARLKAHLYSQLQGLKRINRQQTSILKVPERIAVESYHADQAEQELTAELGRMPSTSELADHLGVSPKRLTTLRRYHAPVGEGQFVNPETGTEEYSGAVSAPWQATANTWQELVHSDLDPHHQLVMEYSLGMFGRPKLSNAEIAAKLKRSPGAISQAKARIQKYLDQEGPLSPFGGEPNG